MAKEPPRRSRLQRALVSIPVMLVLTELGAALIWMATARECFSYDAMQARRDTLIESSPLAAQGMGRLGAIEAEEALHPYVGYVQVDGDGSDSLPYPRTEGLYERRSNALRVVVVGGSVAGQLEEDLPEAIDGRRPGRAPCRVWNLGTGGFKEPQQLALVTYLLTMGAEWDVLVNVDGFNEAVLPIAENVPAHVYPYYPREWSRRAVELSDAELLASIGQVQVWRDMRVDAARWVTNAPLLRWSATANVVWRSVDDELAGRMEGARQDAMQRAAGEGYAHRGPPTTVDVGEVRRRTAAVWARSSVVMAEMGRAYGFAYLHFLQPNQYLEGSKPFSEEERAIALRVDHPYGREVEPGYAELRAQTSVLEGAGVDYHDLTSMFAEEPRVVYEDDCCHFNGRGRRAIAAAVAEAIVSAVDRASE